MSGASTRQVTARVALAAAAALATGCIWTSPAPRNFPPAISPYGARMTIKLLDGRSYGGELLTVTDSNAVLLVGGRVATVPLGAVDYLNVRDLGAVEYAGGHARSPDRGQRAQRMARYPYGMSADVTAALLAATSQAAPDRLESKQ